MGRKGTPRTMARNKRRKRDIHTQLDTHTGKISYIWVHMDTIYGYMWIHMDMYRYICVHMGTYMDTYGYIWV